MGASRPRVVIAAVAASAAAAIVAFLAASRRDDVTAERSAQFQAIVGGLGTGAVLDLSGCAATYDPRVAHGCADAVGPFPGSARFCEVHGAPEVPR